MGLDKKSLDRIVQFVKTVKDIPGNDEFIAELRKVLNDTERPQLSIVDSNIDPKIDHIYEYCIEEIARKQAKEFYADFPISEIVDGLVEDYVRMEYFRRKDNFGDFCLSVYQQIERITNVIYSNLEQCTYINDIRDIPPFDRNGQRQGAGRYQKISDIVWYPSEQRKEPSAMDKVKNAIYFIIDGASEFVWDYDFYSGIYDIYKMRNTNHRGVINDDQLIIQANSSLNYFVFHGLLAQYVVGIKRGIQDNKLAKVEQLAPKYISVIITNDTLPSTLFAKDSDGVNYELDSSKCNKPANKHKGDALSVRIENRNGRHYIVGIKE